MSRKIVAPGVYEDAWGYWARPWINRRRTWRKLRSTKVWEAVKEAAKDWQEIKTFSKLAQEYIEAGCPNRRLEKRDDPHELKKVESLVKFFGRYRIEEIKMPVLIKYKNWRMKQTKKGSGERTVDLDLVTLSNVLSYGVTIGALELNFIRAGRPKFATEVVHSRSRAPENADQIHEILRFLFADPATWSCGWQACFAYLTGCRTSELLRLRADAKKDEAGYISGDHLHLGRRSKGGVHPFVLIHPAMRDMLNHFPKRENWFFPDENGKPIRSGDLRYAMYRACAALKLPNITPHGLRSYYVTVRRSQGATDSQVAAEIGDKTVALIQTIYGDAPANWRGGEGLSWLPKNGEPAWRKFSGTIRGLNGQNVDLANHTLDFDI